MATLLYSTGPLHSPTPRHPSSMLPNPHPAPPTPPHDFPVVPRATVISTFSPRLTSPSPPAHPTTGSNVTMGRSSYHTFVATQSRVIRIFNLPKDAPAHLASLFPAHCAPVSLWTLREEYGGTPKGDEDSVWAVFKSHQQAATALSLSGATVSIATALESDLEPFQKLRKLELRRHSISNHFVPAPTPTTSPISPAVPSGQDQSNSFLRTSQSASNLRERALDLNTANDYSFTLSSNPPNPRNTFRQGDWICANPNCGAHNFMRNVVCIGCGNSRPPQCFNPPPASPLTSLPWTRMASSPRFATVPQSEFITSPPRELLSHQQQKQSSPEVTPTPPRSLLKMPSLPSFPSGGRSFSPNAATPLPTAPNTFSPTVPTFAPLSGSSPSPPSSSNITAAAAAVALKLPSLLTPSGRAFSRGGKVQNISTDPLAPCVIYWPDNEPKPSQRQIRPPGSGHAAPILNTGNKGPIEQQPGDWVCGVCDYLNWRRRKVCQTCYPYAEGNTDGVSAAVQAERIAMLAQLLATQPPAQAQVQVQSPQTHNVPQAQSHPHPHAHTIPTPPHDPFPLPSLRLNTAVSPRSQHPTPPLTPDPWSLSFLQEDDTESDTPPLSAGAGSASPSPQSSAPLVPVPLSNSIWALRKDEV